MMRRAFTALCHFRIVIPPFDKRGWGAIKVQGQRSVLTHDPSCLTPPPWRLLWMDPR